MMLSDGGILTARAEGRLAVTPWNEDLLQPCSVDVRLGGDFRVFGAAHEPIDSRRPEPTFSAHLEPDGSFWLDPGEFALGTTMETVTLGPDLAARYEGKSSIGRLGIQSHITAAFIDAGFSGQITLELHNVNARPVLLYPGMAIGQLAFLPLDAPARRPYGPARGSRYQDQRGATASRVHDQIAEAGL